MTSTAVTCYREKTKGSLVEAKILSWCTVHIPKNTAPQKSMTQCSMVSEFLHSRQLVSQGTKKPFYSCHAFTRSVKVCSLKKMFSGQGHTHAFDTLRNTRSVSFVEHNSVNGDGKQARIIFLIWVFRSTLNKYSIKTAFGGIIRHPLFPFENHTKDHSDFIRNNEKGQVTWEATLHHCAKKGWLISRK